VEANPYQLIPGCIILIRAGETHYVYPAPKPYERIAIHFKPTLISGVDPEGLLLQPFFDHPLGKQNFYPPESLRQDFLNICFNSMCENSNRQDEQRLGILCYLYSILYELRRCFLLSVIQQSGENQPELIKQIIDYINIHLTEPIQIKTLTDLFYINRAYMNRKFKQVTGSTIWQYILSKRLFLAKQQISAGIPSIQAAEQCGWKDYSSFYRQYKSRFGTSPKGK
jgi:AraC-like DNA-binding protein